MSQRIFNRSSVTSHCATVCDPAIVPKKAIAAIHKMLMMSAWVFMCGILAHAQLQGNGPVAIEGYIADGNSSGAGHYDITLPTSVNSGELLVACAEGSTGATPFTVTSTPTETWSSVAVTTVNGRSVQLWYAQANSSTSYTVDLAYTAGNSAGLVAAHYKNISSTLDGAIATNTATGTPATLATSTTTTYNGSLGVSCGSGDSGGTGIMPQSPANYIAFDQASGQSVQAYQYGTAHGSQTFTWKNASKTTGGTGLSSSLKMQTAWFRPSTIAITDTSIPAGGANVAYEAQLHCIGGTGTITYSLASGAFPTGISLNTTTGEITGSTASAGTTALGFQCTDGTVTSSTANLSLVIGTTMLTPAIRQIQVALNANGTMPLGTVVCGSLLGIIMHGYDTHGGDGWLANDSGATNSIKDGNGNVLHRVPIVGNTTAAPLVAYISDPINYSGTGSIVLSKTTSGTPLMSTLFEISGAQSPAAFTVFDNINGNASSPFTLATSYTTKVPNELLVGVTASNRDSDTYSVAAPFSLNIQGNNGVTNTCAVGFDCLMLASTPVATAGSTTLTTTVTSSSPSNDNTTNLMLSFRPGVSSAACPAQSYAGEKIRRQIF